LPAYRWYALSFVFSVIAGQIQTAAVGWELYEKTKSALDLGWLGLVLATPMLLLSLPAGQLADLFSRRKLVMYTQLATATCAVGLAITSLYFHDSTHYRAIVYTLLGIGATGSTIGRPSRQALLPQLVPPQIFSNAITWNTSTFELSSIAGPAIGGLLIWLTSPAVAYMIAAASWLVCFGLVWILPEVGRGPAKGAAGISDFLAGIRFVWTNKLVLATMTLDLFAVLFGGASFLLPVFAKDVLHVGPMQFGFMRAAPSIGAVTMALVQAHRPPLKRAGRAMLLAVAGYGMATAVFGISQWYWLSLLMLALTGVCDNISVVVRHTLIQSLTPDSMRGRVSAVNQIFIGSSNEVGGLESGLTAWRFGPVLSVLGGGIGAILVTGLVACTFPSIRKLGSLKDLKPLPAT
jgi:MFS family permease